jgi:hypothetical protein
MPVLHMLFWTKAEERKHAALVQQVRKHFAPVLQKKLFDERAFYLGEEVCEGSRLDSWLTVEGFITLFGPLVEKGDYHKSSYAARTAAENFHIAESVFDEWQAAGCLLWD